MWLMLWAMVAEKEITQLQNNKKEYTTDKINTKQYVHEDVMRKHRI